MKCFQVNFRDGYRMIVDANSELEARAFAIDCEQRAQPHSAVRCDVGPDGTKIESVEVQYDLDDVVKCFKAIN